MAIINPQGRCRICMEGFTYRCDNPEIVITCVYDSQGCGFEKKVSVAEMLFLQLKACGNGETP